MSLNMQYSDLGMGITEAAEGLKLTAYRDCANVLTIGYGHTHGVYEGMTITKEQAEEFLRADLAWAVNCVNRMVTRELTQSQFDSLVDFVFNEGAGHFASSTLLDKVNASEDGDVREEFARWEMAGGKRVGGLVARRDAEAQLYTEGTQCA